MSCVVRIQIGENLLAVRYAVAVFSSALVLIALCYCAGKTEEIELLTGAEACRIECRFIQGGPASRLSNAKNHQNQHGHENGAAEVFLHEGTSRAVIV